MSKRRTRSEKTSAKHHYTYSYVASDSKPSVEKPLSKRADLTKLVRTGSSSISIQFPHLIAIDLLKTVSISVVIIAILVSLYIFQR